MDNQNNIKTEFEDYKEKQFYFKMLNKNSRKGKLVTKSREKTVDGSYIGITYRNKSKNKE